MKLHRLFILICSFAICFSVWASTWSDPSWKEMLSDSDIIGLFEVVEGGTFKSRLKPIEIYKGRLNYENLWYTGFSDKYGPIDSLEIGQQYFLFLKKPEKYKSRYNSNSNFADKEITEQSIKDYQFVIEQPNGFIAWTPTSGDILKEGDSAYYDLNVTSTSLGHYSREVKPNSSLEFINLLKSIFGKTDKRQYINSITAKLNHLQASAPDSRMISQFICMLDLAGNRQTLKVFTEIANSNNFEAQYSIAKQLRNIKIKDKFQLEQVLIQSEHPLVRAEVIQQMSSSRPKQYGDLLLQHLKVASDSSYTPSLMNPVRNQSDSEIVATIQKLSAMKYKQAAPALMSILQTTEADHIFTNTLKAVRRIGNQDYQSVILDRISSPGELSIYGLGKIALDMKLSKARKPLMQFIRDYGKTAGPNDSRIDVEMAISTLEQFGMNDEVEDFMIDQMSLLANNVDNHANHWVENLLKAYIQAFTFGESTKAQEVINESFFYWFGFDSSFSNRHLILLKEDLELAENRRIDSLLQNPTGRKTNALCFIKNRSQIAKDSSIAPEVEFIYLIDVLNNNLEHHELGDIIKQERALISSSLNIDEGKIGFDSGGSRYSTDNRFFTQIRYSMIPAYIDYTQAVGNEDDLKLLSVIEQKLQDPEESYTLNQMKMVMTAIDRRMDSKKK